jgi:hypothetical protein
MKFVEEKIKKGMEGWMGGSMSIGGRVTKIDACLLVQQCSLPDALEAVAQIKH